MMTEENPYMNATTTLNQTSKRELVEEHGDENQVERYYAGLLPEYELLGLARRTFFQPLTGFSRHKRIIASDVQHSDSCAWGTPQVKFFTREVADGISGDEWIAYRRIQDVATEITRTLPSRAYVNLEIVEHVGVCAHCAHREAVSRAVSVRITWAGHELVREYALGGQ